MTVEPVGIERFTGVLTFGFGSALQPHRSHRGTNSGGDADLYDDVDHAPGYDDDLLGRPAIQRRDDLRIGHCQLLGSGRVSGGVDGDSTADLAVDLDGDGDAVLVRVDQTGAACHTGTRTCFDDRDLGAVAAR